MSEGSDADADAGSQTSTISTHGGLTMVRARFWITKVIKHGNSENIEIHLAPVIRAGRGEKGNVDWSKYTPSGQMMLNVSAAGAQSWFEERLGKDVGITFEDVDD